MEEERYADRGRREGMQDESPPRGEPAGIHGQRPRMGGSSHGELESGSEEAANRNEAEDQDERREAQRQRERMEDNERQDTASAATQRASQEAAQRHQDMWTR